MKLKELKQLIKECINEEMHSSKYHELPPMITLDIPNELTNLSEFVKLLREFVADNNTDAFKLVLEIFNKEYDTPYVNSGVEKMHSALKQGYFVQTIQTNTAWNKYHKKFKVIVQLTPIATQKQTDLVRSMGPLD